MLSGEYFRCSRRLLHLTALMVSLAGVTDLLIFIVHPLWFKSGLGGIICVLIDFGGLVLLLELYRELDTLNITWAFSRMLPTVKLSRMVFFGLSFALVLIVSETRWSQFEKATLYDYWRILPAAIQAIAWLLYLFPIVDVHREWMATAKPKQRTSED